MGAAICDQPYTMIRAVTAKKSGKGLLANVDIKLRPELYRLCEEGETVEDLL